MRFERKVLHVGWADSLRGLGAIWVTLFHLSLGAPSDGSAYTRVVQNGPLGVLIFFVVSGFSVYLSLTRASGPADFARKRFWRIYPPYILAFGLCLAIALARKLATGSNDIVGVPKTFTEVVAILTLTTAPVSHVPTINLVFWTLSYEAAFYLVLTLCAVRRGLSWPIIIAVSVAAIASGPSPDQGAYYTSPSPAFFLNQWSFFALGIAAAEFFRGGLLRGLLLFALCVCDFALNRNGPEVTVALVTAMTLMASMTSVFSLLNSEAILSRVGRWSYSLYLIHVPIGVWIVIRYTGWIRDYGLTARIALDMAILSALILLSRYSWAHLEMRFAKRGKG